MLTRSLPCHWWHGRPTESASLCALPFSASGETILSQDEQYVQEQVLIYNRSSFHSCGFVGQMLRDMQNIILMGGFH